MHLYAYGKRMLYRADTGNKIGLRMRLTLIALTAACLQVCAAGNAQTVTLNLKQATLEQVFTDITAQTGYLFLYTSEQSAAAKRVTINVKNATLEETLNICFKDQPLIYSIVNKTIVVKNKTSVINKASLLTDVKGRVINEKGEPVAGATVQVKGTDLVTSTNENGEFVLHDVADNITIIISGAEIEAKEIKVNNRTAIIASVKIKQNELDGVVMMGYGKTTRRLNTGSIEKVDGETIAGQPVSNPLAALEGRVPGLLITQSNGLPGSSFNVNIRGQRALNTTIANDQPLFVVDGVIFSGNGFLGQLISAAGNPDPTIRNNAGLSPLNLINPLDIESIEILKDADATAIYGSRGANGVILITTKKAKVGKTIVNASFYSGVSYVSKIPNLLNTQQYLVMRREGFANDSTTPDVYLAPDLLIWDTTRYTDFGKLLVGGKALSNDAQVSASGGNGNTQFLIGSGYHRETTVFPGDMPATRASVHFNINHTSIDKKLVINLSGNYASSVNNLILQDLTGYINLPPNFPALFDSTGALKSSEGGYSFANQGYVNPFSYYLQTYKANSENLLGNLFISYNLGKGFSVKSSFGYNSVNVDETTLIRINKDDPNSSPTGQSMFSDGASKSWSIEPQLDYERKYRESKISILAGATFQSTSKSFIFSQGTGYTDNALLGSLQYAASVIAQNQYSLYRYSAAFGRINYNYRNTYILNISGRSDGSSRFGTGNRFAYFGAIGGAWIFTNIKGLNKNSTILNYGKLRASFGTTGNDQIGDYRYLDSWGAPAFNYNSLPGLAPARLYNPNYRWEVNKKLETAVDLELLKSRLFFSIIWYRERSTNKLIDYTLPSQTGFTSVLQNFPAVIQNQGWEFFLSSKNFISKDFNWTTALNLSIPTNKLISFPELSESSYRYKYEIGKSLNVIKAFESMGVDKQTGIYTFNDVNKDGVLDINDYKVFGNTDPKLYGGFRNTLSYKNWNFDCYLEFRLQKGASEYAFQANELSHIVGFYYNQPVSVLSRWKKPGDSAPIQKYTSSYGTPAVIASVYYLGSSNMAYSDASFIRCKSLSLSYNFSKAMLTKIRMGGLRIYFMGQNLFTITHYKVTDPETQNFFKLPPLKTFTAGIQITI